MINPGYTVSRVKWHEAEPALRYIRKSVFIDEQSVPEELEWDNLDDACMHILVKNSRGVPIATARIKADGHIGRMAVLKPYRHQGVGSAILDNLIDYCKQHKLKAHLDAQTNAIAFYQQKGFECASDEFMDAGIPHKSMILEEKRNGRY